MSSPVTPTYSIGIDLGTTHCALSRIDSESEQPEALRIPQVVAPGEVATRELLPSFLYFPGSAEFHANALALPWYNGARDVVGVLAQKQGATSPSRLVSSAKSWLSNTQVDRRAEILPWGAPEGISKVSPLLASARYLAHLRGAWELAHPDTPLAEQDIVLTVPASFDAVARELTLEAAALAGFSQAPRLLEEPQAALYDWLAQRGRAWRSDVSVGDVILVVDIGGGTTDFSLIAVQDIEGSLELVRIAVGDHILLGGDNMDLALAHTVRASLATEDKSLDDWQMRALTHSCRHAKEALLAEDPPDCFPLAIPARGSRLIGGTLRAELSREQVQRVLLDGFFPEASVDSSPRVPRRAGLTALGLPYASDAAVTRHLAAFLRRSEAQRDPGGDGASSNPGFVVPTAVLFNGGVTRSRTVRNRLTRVLDGWLAAAGAHPIKRLGGTHAELAVSRGAAYYAHARRHGGVRIRGGTARAYYIGIERAELAVPGIEPTMDGICIAPFGMEEGSEVELQQPFGLVLGEPVSFRFFASSAGDRRTDLVGTSIDLISLSELAPIETVLDGPPGDVVQVRLCARITEVGTLELAAVDEQSPRRWKLSFNVRVD